MKDIRTTVGIPDTLPPLSLCEVWGWLWLGVTGLLLLTLSFFSHLVPPPWGGLLVLVCWLVLPVKGLFKPSARKLRTDGQKSTSAQVRLYTIIVVGFGVIFTLWARRLGLSWPIVIGTLFFIEALPSVIVSLTEWWRLSTIGFSVGLMICGLGLPFMHGSNLGILFGGAVFLGGLLAAGILYWQLRQHENKA